VVESLGDPRSAKHSSGTNRLWVDADERHVAAR